MESKSTELKKRKRKSSGESAAKVPKTETTQILTTTEEVKEVGSMEYVKLMSLDAQVHFTQIE